MKRKRSEEDPVQGVVGTLIGSSALVATVYQMYDFSIETKMLALMIAVALWPLSAYHIKRGFFPEVSL